MDENRDRAADVAPQSGETQQDKQPKKHPRERRLPLLTKKQWIMIVIALVIVAGIGVGAYIYFSRADTGNSTAPEETVDPRYQAYRAEDYIDENGTLWPRSPTKEEVADAVDRQGFGGVVTVRTNDSVTVKHYETDETKTFALDDSVKVYENSQSDESTLDKVQTGSKVDIGYFESTQKVESIWVWTE